MLVALVLSSRFEQYAIPSFAASCTASPSVLALQRHALVLHPTSRATLSEQPPRKPHVLKTALRHDRRSFQMSIVVKSIASGSTCCAAMWFAKDSKSETRTVARILRYIARIVPYSPHDNIHKMGTRFWRIAASGGFWSLLRRHLVACFRAVLIPYLSKLRSLGRRTAATAPPGAWTALSHLSQPSRADLWSHHGAAAAARIEALWIVPIRASLT